MPSYCEEWGNELGLSDPCINRAISICEKCKWLPVNRTERVTAAGALYLVCLLENEKRTQQEISDVSDVTIPSIRRCYREIGPYVGVQFDSYEYDPQLERPETLFGRVRELVGRVVG